MKKRSQEMDGYVFYTATELNLAILGMIYQYQHHPNPNTDGRKSKDTCWYTLFISYIVITIQLYDGNFRVSTIKWRQFIHLSCTNKFQIYRRNFNLNNCILQATVQDIMTSITPTYQHLNKFPTESDSKYFTILSTWQDEIIKKTRFLVRRSHRFLPVRRMDPTHILQ